MTADLDGNPYWKAPVPPLRYTDGRVGIRRGGSGRGPKWKFTVDAGADRAVGYVDCDLDNGDIPSGEANISYACHPAHRGRGHTSAAVRLVLQFLRGHTGARTADVIVDPRNVASVRVARAVGAVPVGAGPVVGGHPTVRHRVHLDTAIAPAQRA